MTTPDAYVIAHARERLAADELVAALDVDVRIVDRRVFLSGSVHTEAQRERAAALVAEALPGLAVHNELAVADYRELPANAREHLARGVDG